MANILFLGLETQTREELSSVLWRENHTIKTGGLDLTAIDESETDAVFCNGDDPVYKSLLRHIRERLPDLPVVVVTRLPESRKWLDALDAGATDYCSAPFEPTQVRWILAALFEKGKFACVPA